MLGQKELLHKFMADNTNRFQIPLYQRTYNWSEENCRQLYEDLKMVISENKQSHFFGSIVCSKTDINGKTFYQIIDGQQRLTTVTLLLLAITSLINKRYVCVTDTTLKDQIPERLLIDKFAKDQSGNSHPEIKLIPVSSDKTTLTYLFNNEYFNTLSNYTEASTLLNNFNNISKWIKADFENQPVDILYEAIQKLEIILITLETNDDPQLVFESLNSTGLDLTEGDKIKNYLLMNKTIEQQEDLYQNYWHPIEKNFGNDVKLVTDYLKNYLIVKTGSIPNDADVYREFKNYVEKINPSSKDLCSDLKNYADIYAQIIKGRCIEQNNELLNDCMYRLLYLNQTKTYPFFMEVIRLKNELGDKQVLEIFKLIENYIFRRIICDYKSNSYNKLFASLHKNIISTKPEGTDNYFEKLKFILLKKENQQIFPNDIQFTEALRQKNVYSLDQNIKKYMFTQFENSLRNDAPFNLKNFESEITINGKPRYYSVEHIMPQKLTPEWKKELAKANAKNVDNIHEEWLHRLGNLTVILFNAELSNKAFKEKLDEKDFGYKKSDLRLNKWISEQEGWGEKQIQDRNNTMVQNALKIWPYPATDLGSIQDVENESENCCDLNDDFNILTYKKVTKYEFMDNEIQVKDAKDMFIKVVKNLHEMNNTIIPIVINNPESNVKKYFSNDKTKLTDPNEIDNNIYLESSLSNYVKLTILRKLFDLYEVDPAELVIYYK